MNCNGRSLWQKKGSYFWLQRDDMSTGVMLQLSLPSKVSFTWPSNSHTPGAGFLPSPQLCWAFPATPTQGLSTPHPLPAKLPRLFWPAHTLCSPFPWTPAFPGRWYYWGACNCGWKWGSVLGIEGRLQGKMVSHLPFTLVTFELNTRTHRHTHTWKGKKGQ